MIPQEFALRYAGRRVRIMDKGNQPPLDRFFIGRIGTVLERIRNMYVGVLVDGAEDEYGVDMYPDELELIDSQPLPLPG